MQNWQLWAAAAAVFAALPALLIKLGVQGVDAGMATLFPTLAVAIVLALVLLASGRLDWKVLRQLPALSMAAPAAVCSGRSCSCRRRRNDGRSRSQHCPTSWCWLLPCSWLRRRRLRRAARLAMGITTSPAASGA